jgi:hypothetical protein
MAGLPHFQNSLSSLNRYEPVYLNQFEVSIIPPASVAGGSILLEHVTSVGGLALDKNPAPTAQKYKFAKRNYAGAKPDSTVMNVSTSFTINLNDANSMYVFKTLRQWCDLIYNPLTGAMGLKSDYVGTMTISIFNKNGDVFRRIRIPVCFISTPINSMDLNYDQANAIYALNVTWKCDYWEDLFL